MKMENTKNKKQLEKFLLENGFELYTYYRTNKRYVKRVTKNQNLYVRIYSDINKIIEVAYENVSTTNFEDNGIVLFDTIKTIKQLKHLIEALK